MTPIKKQSGWIATLSLFVFLVLQGCGGNTPDHVHHETPHKPKDLIQAVDRLQQIHLAILSDDPLPNPKTFYVHTHDHGHGHSHSHDDDHEHELIEVPIFQELTDIVRWLPKIAANSDAEKEAWDEVDQSSSKLLETLKNFDQSDPETQREQYRKSQELISGELENLIKNKKHFSEKQYKEE